ncbi:phytanoyl-CoA dioxygenase family protein [Streptomyces sp. 4503]|uniref:Phytanoyl-CoA dioxygenase family protein n=1 Tax=Streptomyces niphimycinicus TaxID=2842201 RepID=A0ABS6CHW0_9ACTN|nr:phytanoyl-CoA dioxygenase family protein [Streptomyces niphimycinicus]MBU3866510.1 phytanoyl-CoA dioxygenase family protein [Streptomyces niphimycinicus]
MANNTFTFLPTDDDVAFYQQNGCWISPPILPDDVLDTAERGMRRHYAGDVDRRVDGDENGENSGWRPEDGDVLRKNDYASLRVSELAHLVRQSVIAACAARLAGAPEIRLWHDQLLYKPSGSDRLGNVGWHTDRRYWRCCSSQDMLTAWVPFHDVTEAHGPVMFAAGSHRWNETADLNFFDQDLTTLERHAAEHDLRIVSATLARGQVSFHHCKTVHGSGPNHSGEPRRSIAIHLQPGDNHHVTAHNPDGTVATHRNDNLTAAQGNGTPDYADPVVCPRLWSATS